MPTLTTLARSFEGALAQQVIAPGEAVTVVRLLSQDRNSEGLLSVASARGIVAGLLVEAALRVPSFAAEGLLVAAHEIAPGEVPDLFVPKPELNADDD